MGSGGQSYSRENGKKDKNNWKKEERYDKVDDKKEEIRSDKDSEG